MLGCPVQDLIPVYHHVGFGTSVLAEHLYMTALLTVSVNQLATARLICA